MRVRECSRVCECMRACVRDVFAIYRHENFPRISGIPRILVHSGRSCESSRSVEICFDQYRGGGGLYSP